MKILPCYILHMLAEKSSIAQSRFSLPGPGAGRRTFYLSASLGAPMCARGRHASEHPLESSPPNGSERSRAAEGGVGLERVVGRHDYFWTNGLSTWSRFSIFNPCCRSSEYKTEAPTLSALATLVPSQKDKEYCWRSCDAVSRIDLFNSITGYFS